MRYAQRMGNIKKSFIREILKATADPEVISFAGGLPSPVSFPVDEIDKAAHKVLSEDGRNALQYSTTEGYLPLRQYIAERYMKRQGIKIDADEILITNGSQQGLDLILKVFIDKGDDIIIERPGYLGAIQALSVFEPQFHAVDLLEDGVDTQMLEKVIEAYDPKLFYSVPNFQNPSGITYSEQKRQQTAQIIKSSNTVMIEDDPYGELRFIGKDIPSMKVFLDDAVLLGSFSKIVSPGIRLGWIAAKKQIMEKLIIVKQAADLHSNYFSQRVVFQYMHDNDIDVHISKIRELYKQQRNCMVDMIERYFPEEVKTTKPEGGMFLWAQLPKGCSSLELFEIAAQNNVVFVPGDPFYVDEGCVNTMRLNYTNSSPEMIEEGIRRLGDAIRSLIQ